MTASLFSISHQQYVDGQIVEQQSIYFQTGDEENRNITLGDGTEIRINENSEVIVSADYMKGKREVTLSGEAYFDVEHIPDRPFIIHANHSSVEVLGTAFNVKSIEEQKNVQVAVVEGKVALRGAKNGFDSEELSVILSRNQYGYLDLEKRILNVDDIAVENYLAWKSGRFQFEDLSMQQVCTQLNRIYSIECNFGDDEIRDLKLTANFSNESLHKTLDVISMTLEVEYKLREEKVYWSI
jgi:ferric-dicitrate binding protein FerR (iron transport regulator)